MILLLIAIPVALVVGFVLGAIWMARAPRITDEIAAKLQAAQEKVREDRERRFREFMLAKGEAQRVQTPFGGDGIPFGHQQ